MKASPEFWFHFHGGVACLPETHLRASLADHGIGLYSLADGNPQKAGIYLSDGFDAEAESELRRYCWESPKRVLVVWLGKEELTGLLAKRLADLGVGYILDWRRL